MNTKKLKTIISGTLATIFALAVFNFALAQDTKGTYNFNEQSGLNKAAGTAGFDTSASATSVEGIVSTVIYTFLGLVGVIFLALIIYGGFIWMTAEGSEEKVKKGKNTIISSLFGMGITLAAYAISYFVISYFGQ